MSGELPDKYYRLMSHLLSNSKITKVHIFAPRSQIVTRFEDSVQMFVYIKMAPDLEGDYFDFYDCFKGWTLTQVAKEGFSDCQEIQLELWQKVKI